MPRTTGPSPQEITLRGRTHLIPAHTTIAVCTSGLHYNPSYWGPTPQEFTPQKWDARNPGSGWYDAVGAPISVDVQPGTQLRQPVKGAWVPFAEGFRICLGKKFALVEMAGFLAVVFRGTRVEIARRAGETQEEADKRAVRAVRGSNALLTVAVREEVGVRLVPR